MKRFRATARSHRKTVERQQKPRSNSNPKPYNADGTATAWSSTDPKDLPEGFTVGSMSVPYNPPPQYQKSKSDPFGTYPGKNKRKDKKKAKKDQVDGGGAAGFSTGSPLVKYKVASKTPAAAAKDSPKYLHKMITNDDEFLKRRKEFAVKAMNLERSRSMDALDEIVKHDDHDDDGDRWPKVARRRKSGLELEYPSGLVSRKQQRWTNSRSYYQTDVSHEALQQFQREFSRTTSSTPHKILHKPKNVEVLVETLQTGIEVNVLDIESGDAPIHSIVKRKKKDRLECLLALLVNSDADVNLANRKEMTPLHLAVEEGDEMCVKALIVFGAKINQQDYNQFTPLDLAMNNGKVPVIEQLLQDLGAKGGTELIAKFHKKVPRLHSFAEKMRPPKRGERLSTNDRLSEFINRRGVKKLYHELEMNINRRLSFSASIGGSDDNFALVLQQRELALYNKTLRQTSKRSTAALFNPEGGSRLLFMDGGGIKGLAEIEVLMQLEERTQRKITDLFDWIIGTSTGGIIALAMVYGKKSLTELRQLFFLLKNRIFSKARYGFGYNTENLEEILKEYLDPNLVMSDVTHPKVLIAAVNKATTNLELNFFNNCFGDDYSEYPVWKVARYTSAAPMFFSECDDYVDGGVLCNNPTDSGLTAIQNFYRLQGKKFPIALVVSIGSGKYPPEKLGSVNAQDYLFFGKQWLNPSQLMKRTQSLFALLSNAIVESEMVAENSRSRCEEQSIPFYRFSATLDEIVAAGETDNEKLFNMVLQTKMQTPQQGMDDLVELFHFVAEISKKIVDSIEEEGGELQNESPSVPREQVCASSQTKFVVGEVVDIHEGKADSVQKGYQPKDQDSQKDKPQISEKTEAQLPLPFPTSTVKPDIKEEQNATTVKETESDNHFTLNSEVKSQELHSDTPEGEHQAQAVSTSLPGKQPADSTHSELYKSYKLATQEPLTEEEYYYSAYKLETLV